MPACFEDVCPVRLLGEVADSFAGMESAALAGEDSVAWLGDDSGALEGEAPTTFGGDTSVALVGEVSAAWVGETAAALEAVIFLSGKGRWAAEAGDRSKRGVVCGLFHLCRES